MLHPRRLRKGPHHSVCHISGCGQFRQTACLYLHTLELSYVYIPVARGLKLPAVAWPEKSIDKRVYSLQELKLILYLWAFVSVECVMRLSARLSDSAFQSNDGIHGPQDIAFAILTTPSGLLAAPTLTFCQTCLCLDIRAVQGSIRSCSEASLR